MKKTAGSFEKEGVRKERIVNRSFRGLMCVKQVMNPFKVGLFSLLIISHKLLRWLIPFFLLTAFAGSLYLSSLKFGLFQFIVGFGIIFSSLAFIGYLSSKKEKISSVFFMPYYFILVNLYSLKGVCQSLLGATQVIWSSSRLEDDDNNTASKTNVILISVVSVAFFTWRLFLDLSK